MGVHAALLLASPFARQPAWRPVIPRAESDRSAHSLALAQQTSWRACLRAASRTAGRHCARPARDRPALLAITKQAHGLLVEGLAAIPGIAHWLRSACMLSLRRSSRWEHGHYTWEGVASIGPGHDLAPAARAADPSGSPARPVPGSPHSPLLPSTPTPQPPCLHQRGSHAASPVLPELPCPPRPAAGACGACGTGGARTRQAAGRPSGSLQRSCSQLAACSLLQQLLSAVQGGGGALLRPQQPQQANSQI